MFRPPLSMHVTFLSPPPPFVYCTRLCTLPFQCFRALNLCCVLCPCLLRLFPQKFSFFTSLAYPFLSCAFLAPLWRRPSMSSRRVLRVALPLISFVTTPRRTFDLAGLLLCFCPLWREETLQTQPFCVNAVVKKKRIRVFLFVSLGFGL